MGFDSDLAEVLLYIQQPNPNLNWPIGLHCLPLTLCWAQSPYGTTQLCTSNFGSTGLHQIWGLGSSLSCCSQFHPPPKPDLPLRLPSLPPICPPATFSNCHPCASLSRLAQTRLVLIRMWHAFSYQAILLRAQS